MARQSKHVMISWKVFAQLFLLFSGGVTGLVFLTKYIATKWTDAQFKAKEDEADRKHQERVLELDNQYKLLQQRENLKFSKTIEGRWKALEIFPYALKEIRDSIEFSFTFLAPSDGKGTLKSIALDFVYRIPTAASSFGELVENHRTLFDEKFLKECEEVRALAFDYYLPLVGLHTDINIPIDVSDLTSRKEGVLLAINKLEASIREHVGGNIN